MLPVAGVFDKPRAEPQYPATVASTAQAVPHDFGREVAPLRWGDSPPFIKEGIGAAAPTVCDHREIP